MSRRALSLAILIFGAVLAVPPQPAVEADAVALVRAHAHNDYAHARPLQDALASGFCSVEADVFLVDGELLVAHDADQVRAGRTLQALYLDPLRERARQQGGRLYPHGPECTLLVDVKTGAAETYAVLDRVLARYADLLTAFRGGAVEHRAVMVIVSGNRDAATMALQAVRYAALDGTLADLDGIAPAGLVPWISVDWRTLFTWRADGGAMAARERRLLDALVARAHRQGRRLRLWGAPDTPAAWRLLLDAGVDLINTDDLAGLRDFLLSRHGAG